MGCLQLTQETPANSPGSLFFIKKKLTHQKHYEKKKWISAHISAVSASTHLVAKSADLADGCISVLVIDNADVFNYLEK